MRPHHPHRIRLPPTLPGLADGQGFRTELNPNPNGETIMKEANITRLDVHQAITDRIVASIEADGADTFRMPWNEAGASGLPTNIASGKHYNGINILALWVASLSLGCSRPIWGTYKQWQEKGCQVRKGEKASLVVFYKTLTIETEGEDSDEQGTAERLFALTCGAQNTIYNFSPASPWSSACIGRASHLHHMLLPGRPIPVPFQKSKAFAGVEGGRLADGQVEALVGHRVILGDDGALGSREGGMRGECDRDRGVPVPIGLARLRGRTGERKCRQAGEQKVLEAVVIGVVGAGVPTKTVEDEGVRR